MDGRKKGATAAGVIDPLDTTVIMYQLTLHQDN